MFGMVILEVGFASLVLMSGGTMLGSVERLMEQSFEGILYYFVLLVAPHELKDDAGAFWLVERFERALIKAGLGPSIKGIHLHSHYEK
jgi:hypothetical protein